MDLDDTVFIPTARALELYNREGLMRIHLTYREGLHAGDVAVAVKSALAGRHGREDFTLTTQEDMLRTLSKILNVLTMAVGALGGVMGLALGIGIAQLAHLAFPALPVETPLSFVVLAEAVAVAIGLIAGVLPARRAARLDPVEALRAE